MLWKTRRFRVAILAFFGFFNLFLFKGNLSIAIVAMTENKTETNATIHKPEFHWDSKLEGYILGSFFYGYVCSQLLWGWVSARVGGKRVFGGGLAVSAFINLLIPCMAKINVFSLLVLRFLAGFLGGVACPSLSALWTKWAPPLEKAKLLAIAYMGGCVGTVVMMPVCAYLAESLGWSSIFYFSGVIGLVWALAWFLMVAETPGQDQNISAKELKYITESLGTNSKKSVDCPWKKIATSLPVWAIIVASFTECWGIYTLLILLPKFMRDLFLLELSQTGFLSSLPFVSMIFGLSFSGFLADWLLEKTTLTTTQVRKIFSCGAFICCACLMLLIIFSTTPMVVITCVTLAGGITVATEAGSGVNHFDIAPQYASLIMGLTNTVGNLGGAFSPVIAGYVVTEPTVENWNRVFLITGGVYLFGCIFYGIFGTGTIQKWAVVPKKREETPLT